MNKYIVMFVVFFVFSISISAATKTRNEKIIDAALDLAEATAEPVESASDEELENLLTETKVVEDTSTSKNVTSVKQEKQKEKMEVETSTKTVELKKQPPKEKVKAGDKKLATKNEVILSTSTKRNFHLEVSGRLRVFGQTQAMKDIVNGNSDNQGTQIDLSIQARYRKFGFEWLPLGNTKMIDNKFHGSSFGQLKITTGNELIVKFFPINRKGISVSIGAGVENTSIVGAVSMGGFVFPTTGAGWSPVLQLSGYYHFNKRFMLGFDYEKSNVKIVTKIPGVPDTVTTYSDRMAIRFLYGIF